MKRNCDNCKNEYEAKRPSSRFCSDRCRMAYLRAHPKNGEITPIEMKVLYNQVLELVGKLNLEPVKQVSVKSTSVERNDANLKISNQELSEALEETTASPLDAFWNDLKDADTKEWCLSLASNCNKLTGIDWFKKREFINAANAKAMKYG